jgi:hypothetical protein
MLYPRGGVKSSPILEAVRPQSVRPVRLLRLHTRLRQIHHPRERVVREILVEPADRLSIQMSGQQLLRLRQERTIDQ